MTQYEQAEPDDFWSQRQAALEAKLDCALVAQRDAFDGGRRKLTYLEGHACIAQLNRIFGYGGWSYTLDQMGLDECTAGPEEDFYAQFWAVVTLRVGGASRQDLGTAEIRNTKRTDQRSGVVTVRNNVRNVDSRATARKGAVTDALKRAARTFGQQFGNGLYDQDDNIYAWMAAHALSEDERDKGEPGQAQITQGRAETDDALLSGLRAEVVALLEHDGAALELLRAKGTLPPEMSAEQLRKAKGWLLERERRNVPLSVRLSRAIDEARTPEALRDAQQAVQNAKDSKGVSQAEYVSLLRDAERRRTELSGPLTAGAHTGTRTDVDPAGSGPRSAQAGAPS